MTAPATGVEATGTWLPLADEGAFLAQIAADHPDVTVQTVGVSSTGGFPLRRVTLDRAAPGAPTVLVTGGVHGNEPAGREAVLTMIRDLAYTTHPGLAAVLAATRFEFFPTVNPQGRRDNMRSVILPLGGIRDPNRDYLTSTLPEIQTVQDVAAETLPVMVLDYHEYLAPSASLKTAQTLVTTNPNVDPEVTSLIYELETQAWEGWAAAGIPHQRYAELSADPSAGWNFHALTHAVTLTPETPAHEMAAVAPVDRVNMHRVFTESVLAWLGDNGSRVATVSAAARVKAGATKPFNVGPTTIDPAPIEYKDLDTIPGVLGRYGVAGSLASVLTDQPLYPIIVYVLDEDSPHAQTAATRVQPSRQPVPRGVWNDTYVVTEYGHTPVVAAWYVDAVAARPVVLPG